MIYMLLPWEDQLRPAPIEATMNGKLPALGVHAPIPRDHPFAVDGSVGRVAETFTLERMHFSPGRHIVYAQPERRALVLRLLLAIYPPEVT